MDRNALVRVYGEDSIRDVRPAPWKHKAGRQRTEMSLRKTFVFLAVVTLCCFGFALGLYVFTEFLAVAS